MAATIPSESHRTLSPWIIEEIVKEKPDCIVLTEFVVSRGTDFFLKTLEDNHYKWFISSTTKYNGILIAVHSDSFDTKGTCDYAMHTVKNGADILGKDSPDIYEIQVTRSGRPLTIIGVRICVPIGNAPANLKEQQFKLLDDYLSSQKHDVLCIGDFNAYWGNTWNTQRNTTLPKTSKSGYSLHTPEYRKGDWYSYVQKTGDKNQLDHLITNLQSCSIEVKYDWSFITPAHGYDVTKESADKPKGLPDHAILKASIGDEA